MISTLFHGLLLFANYFRKPQVTLGEVRTPCIHSLDHQLLQCAVSELIKIVGERIFSFTKIRLQRIMQMSLTNWYTATYVSSRKYRNNLTSFVSQKWDELIKRKRYQSSNLSGKNSLLLENWWFSRKPRKSAMFPVKTWLNNTQIKRKWGEEKEQMTYPVTSIPAPQWNKIRPVHEFPLYWSNENEVFIKIACTFITPGNLGSFIPEGNRMKQSLFLLNKTENSALIWLVDFSNCK